MDRGDRDALYHLARGFVSVLEADRVRERQQELHNQQQQNVVLFQQQQLQMLQQQQLMMQMVPMQRPLFPSMWCTQTIRTTNMLPGGSLAAIK